MRNYLPPTPQAVQRWDWSGRVSALEPTQAEHSPLRIRTAPWFPDATVPRHRCCCWIPAGAHRNRGAFPQGPGRRCALQKPAEQRRIYFLLMRAGASRILTGEELSQLLPSLSLMRLESLFLQISSVDTELGPATKPLYDVEPSWDVWGPAASQVFSHGTRDVKAVEEKKHFSPVC